MPISVDPPETSEALQQRLGISLELYTDAGGALATALGVYDADTEIALAATLVIRKGGAIAYKYVGADKTDRPDVDAVLEAARPPDP